MAKADWVTPRTVALLDASGLQTRLAWALDVFVQRGAQIPKRCRATNALAFLAQLAEADLTGSSTDVGTVDPTTFAAFHRTAWELFLIGRAATLCDGPASPFTAAKLNEVVLGTDGEEGRDTLARNTQFELLMAARFCLGGVSIAAGEPDLLINCQGEMVGIAVKRLTSLSDTQLRKRIGQAVEQIERSQRRGIIALNLEARLEGVPAGATTSDLLRFADTAFMTVHAIAKEYGQRPALVGMLALSSLLLPHPPVAANGRPLIDFNTPVQHWIFANVVEEARLTGFFRAWSATLMEELLFSATGSRGA